MPGRLFRSVLFFCHGKRTEKQKAALAHSRPVRCAPSHRTGLKNQKAGSNEKRRCGEVLGAFVLQNFAEHRRLRWSHGGSRFLILQFLKRGAASPSPCKSKAKT